MSETRAPADPDHYTLQVVGEIRSPYREKFGIPRQPGLAAVDCWLEMRPGFDREAMFEGLQGFSHLWLTFVFHGCVAAGWRERVRPPRLGGNRRVGVFASRAPFRPNHLGLSVVELVAIERGDGLRLRLRGADLLDGTPVLDIKPYLPYADALPDARAGFAPQAPVRLTVRFGERAAQALRADPALQQMIVEVLGLDPRPAYQQDDPERVYGMRFGDVNLRFRIGGGVVEVLEAETVAPHGPV